MRDVAVRQWWWRREIGDRRWWPLLRRRRKVVVEEIRVMGKVRRALNVPLVMMVVVVVVGRKIHGVAVRSYRIKRTGGGGGGSDGDSFI